MMNELLKRVGDVGIVPVVKIEDASAAVNLGKVLLAGDLPGTGTGSTCLALCKRQSAWGILHRDRGQPTAFCRRV